MEKSLPLSTEEDIERFANGIDGVSNLHNLRTRKIGNYCAIEFSVCMDGNVVLKDAHEAITQIENDLHQKYGSKSHIIIHVEPLHNISTK